MTENYEEWEIGDTVIAVIAVGTMAKGQTATVYKRPWVGAFGTWMVGVDHRGVPMHITASSVVRNPIPRQVSLIKELRRDLAKWVGPSAARKLLRHKDLGKC